MLLTPVQPPTRDGPLHRASRGKPQPTQRLSGLAVESMVRHRMTPGRSRYRLPRPLRGGSITTWAWWEASTASPILARAGTWVAAFEIAEPAVSTNSCHRMRDDGLGPQINRNDVHSMRPP